MSMVYVLIFGSVNQFQKNMARHHCDLHSGHSQDRQRCSSGDAKTGTVVAYAKMWVAMLLTMVHTWHADDSER